MCNPISKPMNKSAVKTPEPAKRSVRPAGSAALVTSMASTVTTDDSMDVKVHYSAEQACANIMRELAVRLGSDLLPIDIMNMDMNFNALLKKDSVSLKEWLAAAEEVIDALMATSEDSAELSGESMTGTGPASAPDAFKRHMRMSMIINSIAQALSIKLGDPRAMDQIAEAMTKHLSADAEGSPSGLNKETVSLLGANPVFQYLHNEINAVDAVSVIRERADKRDIDALALYEELKSQAMLQASTLVLLAEQHKGIEKASTPRLNTIDAYGLYSMTFLHGLLDDSKQWTGDSIHKLEKIKAIIATDTTISGPKYPIGDNPAPIIKAARRSKKQESTIRAKAITRLLEIKLEPLVDEETNKARWNGYLDQMLEILRNAPITITRFADSLLSKELSDSQPGGLLKPGTAKAGISLRNLLYQPSPRRGLPDDPASQARYSKPDDSASNPEISYVPLLYSESPEAQARGELYPVFRQYKNALFAGKQKKEKLGDTAIFGSLCLNPQGAMGFYDRGTQPGTYGDVTFVLRDSVKNSGKVLYTNGDRGRGYTDLSTFLYTLFVKNEDKGLEIMIDRGDNVSDQFGKVGNILFNWVVRGCKPDESEILEVQIYRPIRLSKEDIQAVYFSSAVKQEQMTLIKNKLDGVPEPAPTAPDSQTSAAPPGTSAASAPAIAIDYYKANSSGVKQIMEENSQEVEDIIGNLYREGKSEKFRAIRNNITRKDLEIILERQSVMGIENYIKEHYTAKKIAYSIQSPREASKFNELLEKIKHLKQLYETNIQDYDQKKWLKYSPEGVWE